MSGRGRKAGERSPLLGGDAFAALVARAAAESWGGPSIGAVMTRCGAALAGAVYRESASTDAAPADRPVDLTGMDCVTFLMNAFAFARLLRAGGSASPKRFLEHVESLRRRGGRRASGVNECYEDCLDDWTARGLVRDITPALGGRRLRSVPKAQSGRTGAPRPVCCAAPDALERAAALEEGDIATVFAAGGGGAVSAEHVGLLRRDGAKVGFLHMREGAGVVSEPSFPAWARRFPGVAGVSILRPI